MEEPSRSDDEGMGRTDAPRATVAAGGAGEGGDSVADGGEDGGYTWQRAAPLPDELADDEGAAEGEDEEDDMWGVDDVPDFADEKTKQIHAEVQRKEKRIEAAKRELVEQKERFKSIAEHLKNVQQEVLHAQALVDAKTREIETEDHLKQLAEREKGRYVQETRRIAGEHGSLQDKLAAVQNQIFVGNQQMDQFKMQMNWNQEELEQWALAAKQKEEDNLALQKYTRADESKIKELNLQIEKLTRLVSEKRTELDDEVTETQAKQIELDKTAEEFRELHAQRQKLISQWQASIETMKRRDAEIAAAGERFAKAKLVVEKKQDELAKVAASLKNEEAKNAALEVRTEHAQREVSAIRQDARESAEESRAFSDEVELLKQELSSAANELAAKRSANVVAEKELEKKREVLEAARKRYHTVKEKLDRDVSKTQSVEQSAKDSEDALAEQEECLKKGAVELQRLKEQMFKASQELFKLRQEEANMISEIAGAQATGKNSSTKIHGLDQESLRQQELIYNAEFQVQQLERKVARASGERTGDEKKVLNDTIAEKQTELEAAQAQRSMLQTQVRKLGDEMRAEQRNCKDCIAEKAKTLETIAELELESKSADAEVNGLAKRKGESMVQSDVMKLELRRLRDQLNSRADEVFSLENRKFQLQMSMEERKKEIAVHREVQRAQVRAAEEERHKSTIELAERTMRVDKLRAKYEATAKASGADPEGGEQSQAFFVIQAAQKKEELQREGDELDAKIRKCEREIRALENTLKLLTVRNTAYRESFQKADPASAKAKQLNDLTEQTKDAQDILFKRKKAIQRLQTDFEVSATHIARVFARPACAV
jgi:coiled-coil domain-containing protein 39